MRKYKKAKIVFEDKAIDKKRKPIYATRKLSIGLVSCMLGIMLFVPTSKADEANSLPASEQIEKNTQPEQTQDLKAGLEETTNNKTPENNQEELLTEDEIQEIRNRTNSLENDYYFNGDMVEELKAELRNAKADPSVNYEEAKARLINEAIIKNTPTQKAPGEDRAVNNFNIKDADKLEAGMDVINVRGLGMETGQIIEVLVNGEVKGTYTQEKRVKPSVKIKISEPLKVGDKVKAILKGSDGAQIAATEEATAKKAKPKKNEEYKDKLKMPTGEIWIEQYVANIVNEEEKAEALDMLKKANTTEIANDIKSIDFEIVGVGTKTASYTVTYDDNSKSDKILAPNLTVKQVTEYSAATNVKNLVVTDTKITGKLVPQKEVSEGKFEPDPNGTIAKGTKVIAILNPSGNDGSANYCTTGKCSTDKNSSTIGEATVNSDGTFEINVPNGFDYKQEVGLTVKEPHKFKACNSTTVEYVIPKVLVRDPKKLTDEEKNAIKEAVKKANTRKDGVSKLPNGTGYNLGIPAFIEVDNQGNVKIISGNDVAVEWDNDGKPIVQKNDDGTVKVETGKENDVVPVKKEELLENKAPDAPTITTNVDKGEITITPNPLDTDAKKIEVKYTDPQGNQKTETIEKGEGENGKWKAPEGSKLIVDENTGVVTVKFENIKNKTNVDAKVTDDGGIANNDKDAKTSDNNSEPIRVLPQKPNITVDNKTGDVTITPIEKDKDRVAKKMDVIYTPAGETDPKTVTFTRDKEGKWSVEGKTDFEVSQDGKKITIKNNKIKANTNIKAKTNDADETDKLVSEENQATIPDKTAPKAPEVSVNTNDGSAQIKPPKDIDTKTVTVKYPDPNGVEKTAIATKDNDGWKITQGGDDGVTVDKTSGLIKIPYDKMKKADTVSATATDESGNPSKSSTDTTLPPVPSVEITDKKVVVKPPANTPSVNGMEITYTPANSDNTKTINVKKGNDDKWKLEGDPITGISVDENSGKVTFEKGTAKEMTSVIAKSKIDDKKIGLEEATAKVPDTTAPEAPEVKVQNDGSVTITPKEGSDTKTVTVTYKNQDGEDKTATATKGDNGEWTVTGTNGETIDKTSGVITIPKGKSNPGDKVEAKAKDPSNNESDPSNDTTMPAPPTVTPDQKSGNVTITPPEKGNLDGMDIEYKTPDNKDRKVRAVKGTDKKWKIEGENPDGVTVAEDTGLVTIPKGKAKEKTEVKADSTLGKKKAPAEKTPENQNLVPDKTAPNPPTVKVEDNGNVTINPPSDEDTTSVTVTYKKSDNTEIKVKAKKAGNKWSLTKEDGSPIDNGESVNETSGVITLAKGKYKTGEIVKAYGNDNVDNKSSEDNKTPVEVTIDVNGGKQNIDGSILSKGGNYILPEIYDKQFFPEDKEFVGWEVESQTKKAGETIKINANTTIKAVWKDIEYKVTFNGNTGTGKMDEKLVKKGKEYTLPENGFTAPEGKKFDGWMVGTEKKAVGAKITVNSDTEVKAIWKDIEYKVTFNGNTGTGKMDEKLVKKGNEYTLPENGFTAPKDKVFDGWMIGKEKKAVGDKIAVNADTEVKAIWKDIEYKVSFNGNTGTGSMKESTVKKGGKYKLPENKFQAPNNKEFKTWEVDGKELAVGTEITVDKDTEIKAIWKDKASTQNPKKPEKIKPSESSAKTKRKIEVKHTTPINKKIKNVKTGVESVAGAAAGLIAAAGGLFVSKKRKK